MKDFEQLYYESQYEVQKKNEELKTYEERFKLLQDAESTSDKAWNFVWWACLFLFVGGMMVLVSNIFLQAIQQP